MQVAEEPVYEKVAVNVMLAITCPYFLQVAVLAAVFVLARALGLDSIMLYSIVIPSPKSMISVLSPDGQESDILVSLALAIIGKLKSKVNAAKIEISFFIRILLSGC